VDIRFVRKSFEAALTVDLRAEPVPLATDRDGVIRVAGSRVTLDSVVSAFHQRLGAEEIAERYPSLSLADTYSVIGYSLRHRSTLDAYLNEQRMDADQAWQRLHRRYRHPVGHGKRSPVAVAAVPASSSDSSGPP
jgi:uncharacterized protein (DUF433 family)